MIQNDIMGLFSESTGKWFRSAFTEPTEVQKQAWPAIAKGKPVLISAPTGTGKTLSAFLYFLDQLKEMSETGQLNQELYLIYISPLKSLAADIRENLKRPLYGIFSDQKIPEIEVGIRTGDTPQKDRQKMIRRPPHILITTPESLYLMLTSASGRKILHTAKAVILDELHAMIDTKRGAHLMFSLARLDHLTGSPLMRIGLSATIEPLEVAAEYLSPLHTVIVAPTMQKKIQIEVKGILHPAGRKKDPIWEELGRAIYEQCKDARSVIAFTEGRRYAEKVAYYVNELGGDGFARVHHGSLSKEQRAETEEALRDGRLRLLCATSSMELGIDVGQIDEVLQIGCPRTVSSTMQRLGRAGHNPGRTSKMYMYPRTAPEALYCGMTAEAARLLGVEHANPPKKCLDVLSQHLVSMAAAGEYLAEDALALCRNTYSFRDVSMEELTQTLCMLAGDYEHNREIPVRPRILFDRINNHVMGDTYSRMLAVAAGGTIPDKGLYAVKTQDGVKLGELDEEFVYESRIGDRFVLGSFAWRIVKQDKDTVVVEQAAVEGARLPFWKGEIKGRSLKTSLSFGQMIRHLGDAYENGILLQEVRRLGLDESAGKDAADFLERQIKATGVLPDDRTIVVERFTDQTGSCLLMVHSLFGRRVNAPLSILMQQAVKQNYGLNVGCVDEEDGFLLYPYGKETLPEGLLYSIDPDNVKEVLKAMLPATPLFGMAFRYNAARALMMGMKQNGRMPLWMQRLRSAEMLDSLLSIKDHPLVQETTRECLENVWDLQGLHSILSSIRSGTIAVKEIYLTTPSPMSLPFQWQIEAAEMYEYSPVTHGTRQSVYEQLEKSSQIKPSAEELEKSAQSKKKPEDQNQLHSLFMMEGDLIREELDVPVEWMQSLVSEKKILSIEPGLWIAAEKEEEYEKALVLQEKEVIQAIIRRTLFYRGAKTMTEIKIRYLLPENIVTAALKELCSNGSVTEDNGFYYHSRLYEKARKNTVKNLRLQIQTCPASHYSALLASKARCFDISTGQLNRIVDSYCYQVYPAAFWENILFPSRVKNYKEAMLDKLLAEGDYYWRFTPDGGMSFGRYEDLDWDKEHLPVLSEAGTEETILYHELSKRGASFTKSLYSILPDADIPDILLTLAGKGLVCADSFVPVRQWQNRDKIKKATVRQRVNARVMALSAGRWDILRPILFPSLEILLHRVFDEYGIASRETFRRYMESAVKVMTDLTVSWQGALEMLSIWEFTGKVRRGYFVEGMSGAQFIRSEEYDGFIAFLKKPAQEIVWLHAQDPAQIWGKILPHNKDRSFQNLPGTLVLLCSGSPAAVLERKGRQLRVFDFEYLDKAMELFAQSFLKKQMFPEIKRLIIKEYPKEAVEALQHAGFLKEMNDYVLYR